MSHSAFTARHSLRVVVAIGWSDFVLKYRGSFLGYLWSFMVPLSKFIVIYHIFRQYVTDVPFYALYLFLGIILWEHFAMTTIACMGSLTAKVSLIKKILFPRSLIMLATGWTSAIVLATYLIVFFILRWAMGGHGSVAGWWYLPILFIQSGFIAVGTGALISAFSLKFKDIPHLWTVLLQVFFWLTPVMYAYNPEQPVLQDLRNKFAEMHLLSIWSALDLFIRFQPLSLIMYDARRAFLYQETAGAPSMIHIAGLTGVCGLFFLVSMIVFRWRSAYFVEEY